MTGLPVIEFHPARRHAMRTGDRAIAVSAGKKKPAGEDEMPAAGTIAARLPGEDRGTSRFKGS
jgi:hypothetical protein